MNIFVLVESIFQEIFLSPQLKISYDMATGDIPGWDSFKNVEILLACEKKFVIRFRSKEIDALKTVGDLVAAIELKLSNPK
ncbi:acyl carrier protein [Polynucleobacter paneuropaeus]|nr:acyl carrier protein [Polynucleobacter paneuropaeus]